MGRNVAEAVCLLQIAHHQGKRFVAAWFALTQPCDCGSVAGIDQQVKPAQPLERYNLTIAQCCRRLVQGICVCSPLTDHVQVRPTDGAGIGLGMEAAVIGGIVFGLAGRAQGEVLHGSVDAVIGECLNDGEARAAVGAVGKGVAEAAVARVGNVGQTVGTGSDIGQYQSSFCAVLVAVAYLKCGVANGVEPGSRQRILS